MPIHKECSMSRCVPITLFSEERQYHPLHCLSVQPPVFRPEDQRYHYGNYDMYYGYRCSGRGSAEVSDPRLGHMKREWFEGKDCLDIGCNTGQVRSLSLLQ